MIINLFLIYVFCFVNQEISAKTYKKFYLEKYTESNSSEINSVLKSDSVLSLGCSPQKKSNKSEENSTVVLSAKDNGGIVISVHSLKFEKSCDSGESVKFESKAKMFMICDRDFDPHIEARGMIFKGDNVTIVFTGKPNISTYCDFTVTAFRKSPCERNHDFKCSNGICIRHKLICDHRNNCGDNSDEAYSLCRSREGIGFPPLHSIIPIIGLPLLFLLCCFVKLRNRRPRYDAPEVAYIYDGAGGYRSVPTVGGQGVTQVPANAQTLNAGSSKNPNERIPNQNEPSTSKQGTDEEGIRKSEPTHNETSSAKNKSKTFSQDFQSSQGSSKNPNERFPNQNEPLTSKQDTDKEDTRKSEPTNNETSSSKNGPNTSSQDPEEDSTKDSKSGIKNWWFKKK